MIEILPTAAFWSGKGCVHAVVDLKAYLHIYNEIFVEEWDTYIERKKAGHDLFLVKLALDEPAPEDSMPFDFLSLSEKLRAPQILRPCMVFRDSKKCLQIKRLIRDFDSVRNIIACYHDNFYAYTIQTIFESFIAVYMLDEHDISTMLNSLYLTFHKRTRVFARDSIFKEVEQNYELPAYQ
jgi:hypothetical protein